MKAITKYPGSKWSIADWIINFFPEHHSYLEPFFGSGAVLFNKPRSHIETINDLDGNVVNLFECIKKDPERLARDIYFTPYSREVYEKVGWKNDVQGRERSYASQDWCNLPEKIMQAAERLRGVQIENRPAIELIKRFNYKNVLIYCDPPYMLSTRHGKQYRMEMEDKEHEALLDALLKHEGYVVISGYDTPLYNAVLKGWEKRQKKAYTQVSSPTQEIIWMNFGPQIKQLSLADYQKEGKFELPGSVIKL